MHMENWIVVDKDWAKCSAYTHDRVLSKYVGEQVLNCLDSLSEGLYVTCKNCGGLTPEIKFSFGNWEYIFTCTGILDEKGKLIAKSDYKLLEKYCHALNTKSS